MTPETRTIAGSRYLLRCQCDRCIFSYIHSGSTYISKSKPGRNCKKIAKQKLKDAKEKEKCSDDCSNSDDTVYVDNISHQEYDLDNETLIAEQTDTDTTLEKNEPGPLVLHTLHQECTKLCKNSYDGNLHNQSCTFDHDHKPKSLVTEASAHSFSLVKEDVGQPPGAQVTVGKRHPTSVLVLGGAGYIGSHCVLELLRQDKYNVIVVDNFSTGHREAILPGVAAIETADIRDTSVMSEIFCRHSPVTAVFHFCASIEVAESMVNPLAYYSNNVTGTLTVLEMLQRYNVKYIVFSSTASVYGTTEDREPIAEDAPMLPTSAYGETKRTVENALHWCDRAYGLRFAVLRYFNACGADADAGLGEAHPHETHLIPLLLQVATGRRQSLPIYGEDYPTPDGTCVRDYVHVSDLATAHIRALEFLQKHDYSECFNLGSGRGHSVNEVIAAVRRVTGHPIPVEMRPRRAGDSPSLVASCRKAETLLGWQRRYSAIDDIVESAWRFFLSHPDGYRENHMQRSPEHHERQHQHNHSSNGDLSTHGRHYHIHFCAHSSDNEQESHRNNANVNQQQTQDHKDEQVKPSDQSDQQRRRRQRWSRRKSRSERQAANQHCISMTRHSSNRTRLCDSACTIFVPRKQPQPQPQPQSHSQQQSQSGAASPEESQES